MKDTQEKVAFIVLVIIQLVGLVGLNFSDTQVHFKGMVSINLLFISAIVFVLHPRWNKSYLLFIGLVFLGGMIIEAIGVKVGQPFGSYRYTRLLGTSIYGVPLVIGMNWVLLIYCAGMLSRVVDPSLPIRIFFGALLMLLMDILIEPFAIRHGLWVWENGMPPIQNYIAWFGASLLFMTLFHVSFRKISNGLASKTYILLLVFFLADWIIARF